MTPPPAPLLFVSHASEDKDAFARPFATRLRQLGVDAWLDEWEMAAGDSLVQRIFAEGITRADFFVIVLSATSIHKPWVREELDSAVVKRIEDGKTRIIPVVLGIGKPEVPASIRHLIWEPATDRDPVDVAQRVADIVFGRSVKPALGVAPSYAALSPTLTSHTTDEAVLRALVDYVRAWGLNGANLQTRFVMDQLEDAGISTDALEESMHALTTLGAVTAIPMAGGGSWLIQEISDHVWLKIAEEEVAGSVEMTRRAVLSSVLNEHKGSLNPKDFDADAFTLRAVLRQLENERLLSFAWVSTNVFNIVNVSPLARCAL